MDDFSEQSIRENCPHCDPNSFALKHPLKVTDNFWVVCDVHPISRGHVLIIPKQHLSCIGEYSEEVYKEFIDLYHEFSAFIKEKLGAVSSFEHGKISQTVFHSHVHLVPFNGLPTDIVPEGENYLTRLSQIGDLKDIFQKERQYLFFSIEDNFWTVDTSLAAPRFFRDRFSRAFGNPEKGNWKEMRANATLMEEGARDIAELEDTWKEYCS